MTFATEETLTALALERWGTAHTPRLQEIMGALVRHVHDFAREVQLTHEEWLAGTEYLSAVGRISDDKRKEFILLSDVLGLSMLVVMINGRTPTGATPNTVVGPFHIDDSPPLACDGDMAPDIPGVPTFISGVVRDLDGRPIAGAKLDIWQADEDGNYETQIPGAEERLRAIQHTDENGRYAFWTIAPKGYTIPMDGPVGALIRQTDISHFRPSHVHFIVSSEGYETVVTHLFQEGAEYIDTDVVFGTRPELVVPFVYKPSQTLPDGTQVDTPHYAVEYDFTIVKTA